MGYKVVADFAMCQGHQMCQGEAPGVFGWDGDNDVVTVLDEHPDESVRSDVESAVKYCPAVALSIKEED